MDLVADYTHPTPHQGRCRVRIYLPEEERDAPVVVCSELPDNRGMSVTNAAERIAAEVIKRHGLAVPVWIEQRTAETAHGPEERFALTVFSDYEVRELPPYLGVRLTIGDPTFKSLDRATVETMVGREV
ncbi:MAG: hypothetical protein M3Q49_06425 [Actinomycetota bacterium]|jgi:hypothetical protein|nr:hypothetical protein [Actinomycetota bacterium]MDP9485413.1 hypothetical protein [Actinomycetota bacterium]